MLPLRQGRGRTSSPLVKKRGIEVRTGVEVKGHTPGDNGTTVSFGDGEQITVDVIVMSVGPPTSHRRAAAGRNRRRDRRAGLRFCGREHAHGGRRGVRGRRRRRHTAARAVGLPRPIVASRTSWARSRCRSTTAACRGASIAIPRSLWRDSEEAGQGGRHRCCRVEARFAGNGRALIIGELRACEGDRGKGAAARRVASSVCTWWAVGHEQLGQGYLAVNWEATPKKSAVHPAAPTCDIRETAGAKRIATADADISAAATGETVTEGTITRWGQQVGDKSRRRGPFEVSTDKVDSRSAGAHVRFLTEILVPEGRADSRSAPKLAVISDAAPTAPRHLPSRKSRSGSEGRGPAGPEPEPPAPVVKSCRKSNLPPTLPRPTATGRSCRPSCGG